MGGSKMLAGAAIGALAATQVLAQGSAARETKPAVLEEIIVTAERRSTDVQDTALAITALPAVQLERSGVNSAFGLTALVPGVTMNSNQPIQNIFVRGVGGGITNNYGDPAVAFNIDGVYIQRPFGGPSGTFFDLDRVEVLKGPQGTLYGRNATVGAINVVTRLPTPRLEGSVGGEVGNYGNVQANGAINLPLSERLALRAAFKTNQHDGYLTNGYNDADSVAARLSLLYQPSDATSLRVSADYFHDTPRGPQTVFIYQASDGQKYTVPGNPWFGLELPPCAVAIQCPTMPSSFLPLASRYPVAGSDAFVDNTMYNLRAELNVEFAAGTLTVLPAYVSTDAEFRYYSGGFLSNTDYAADQYTLEARFASNADSDVSWLVGAFAYAERMDSFNEFNQPQGFLSSWVPNQKDDSYALFGQVTYPVTDVLRLTGGLRFTTEEKSVDGETFLVNVPPPTCLAARGSLVPGPEVPPRCRIPNAGSTDEDNVSWKAGIEYDLAAESLLFATVSTGFKAGGLYFGTPPNTYRPEQLTSYQLGSKNRFFDQRLQLNLEVFLWDYEDQQVYTFANIRPAGFANYPVNADGWVRGAELNLIAAPTDKDRFTLDLVYLQGEFEEYVSPGATLVIPPSTVITIVPPATFRDTDRPNTPTWNGTVSYERRLTLSGGGQLLFNLSSHFESDTSFDIARRRFSDRDAYHMEYARFTYVHPDNRFSVTAFVDNLADEDVFYASTTGVWSKSVTYAPPNPNAWAVSIYPPRTYGLRFDINFGGRD